MRSAARKIERDVTERHMRRIRPLLGIQPVEVYEPSRRPDWLVDLVLGLGLAVVGTIVTWWAL